MNERKQERRVGIVGPLILIALGVIFLLNNLGVLDWSLWAILLRLWPILLVAAGLDLMVGWRSVWGSLLALVLTLAVLAGVLWISEAGFTAQGAMDTVEISQPLEDVRRAEIVIDPGVGTLRIDSLADSRSLVEGTVQAGDEGALTRSFSAEGDTGTFELRTDASSFPPLAIGWTGQRLWALQLNETVALNLETHLGVGEMDLDLTGLDLDALTVDQGLGQATVILPEEGEFEGEIDGAIGQTIVVIPESLAVRILLDTGITAREMPEDYECREDVCTSPDYETADERVELQLGQAIGSLVVRH